MFHGGFESVMTVQRLLDFFDSYLIFDPKMDLSRIDPYMTNGLLVKGKEEVKTIGFAVSASIALFEKAKEAGCDAIIVHHSFNLPPFNRYDQVFQNRLGFLIQNGISLFGYHFLLDAHPQIGNNVQILKTIGAAPVQPYSLHGEPWGWIGELEKPQSFAEVMKQLQPHLSPQTVLYEFGPKIIRRVAAVSGKGAPTGGGMQELLDKTIDLYITGEAHEWNRELFREAGIHLIAGGHYATEVFGVKALMEKVQQKFSAAKTVWVDLPNDI